MVTAQGPHTLTNITLNIDPLSSNIADPNHLTLTSPDQHISLAAAGHYINDPNNPTPLLPDQIHFHASDPSILQVTPEGEVFPNHSTTYNGKAYILGTIIDPNFTQSPDRNPDLPRSDPNNPCLGGVTERIPISVDIPTWQEKENLPLTIIVAGEKEKQDYLWWETHTITRYAYLTLLGRGYSRSRIKYLTHLQQELLLDQDPDNDHNTDLDGDGDPNNDIDGTPSLDTL